MSNLLDATLHTLSANNKKVEEILYVIIGDKYISWEQYVLIARKINYNNSHEVEFKLLRY